MSRSGKGQSNIHASPVDLLDLVLHGAKYGVSDGQVQVFNDLHVGGRHHDTHIAERFHFPALKASDAGSDGASAPRETKSRQNVGRVPASADGAGNVAGLKKIFQLLGKNVFVVRIVGPGGNQGDIVGKSKRAQASAGTGHSSLPQIASQVRGQRGAAPIAKKKDRSASVVGLKKRLDQTVDCRNGHIPDGGGQLFEVRGNIESGKRGHSG